MIQTRSLLLMGMVLYVVGMRVLPYCLSLAGMDINPGTTVYPWNFSPMTAFCLFGGAYFVERRAAFLVPLIALLLGDVLMGVMTGDSRFTFHPGTAFVYGSFALVACIGLWLRKHRSPLAIGGAALLAETLFFVITNFGQWLAFDTYPHTAAGLNLCFVAALPFFNRSLIGTALYCTAMFGGYALAERRLLVPKSASVPVTD